MKNHLPSGEQPHSNGKSPFLMEKNTISMTIFNCYVSSPEGNLSMEVKLPEGNHKWSTINMVYGT